MNITQKVLLAMLREPIQHLLCDSGCAYGYGYERAQKTPDEIYLNQSVAWIETRFARSSEADCWNPAVTIELFPWLVERLEFDPTWDAEFRRFSNKPTNKHEPGLALVEPWLDSLKKRHEVAGIYGEGEYVTVNTYNGESLLSDVMQFTYATVDQDVLIILSIHGGADVRSGYPMPRVFTPRSYYDETAIFDQARATIYCTENPDHTWDTDDSANWYYQGSCGYGAGRQLEHYPLVCEDSEDFQAIKAKHDELDERRRQDDLQLILPGIEGRASFLIPEAERVVLCYDGYLGCPLCGGKLEASA